MAIKLHHGPPGSYKTSGAVMDDVIPAIKAGRVIVTNIRGLSVDRAFETIADVPDSFDIIHVDSTTKDGRDKLARWFHWVPQGALLILDEAQSIFPKKWRQSDIDSLDFPGGIDAAQAEGRPHDWSTAWEMHRHYNWDVVLTTPSIKLIRTDIRECAEGAYKHKNLAMLGFGGRYLEGFHAADSNGSTNDFITVQRKKISKEVWGLYESTATGQHQDSQAGQSIFKNVKLLVALAVFAGSTGYSVYSVSTTESFIPRTTEAVTAPGNENTQLPNHYTGQATTGAAQGAQKPMGNLAGAHVANSQVYQATYSLYGLTGLPNPEIQYSNVYRLVGIVGGYALVKSRAGGPAFRLTLRNCVFSDETWCHLGDQVRITRFSGVIYDTQE